MWQIRANRQAGLSTTVFPLAKAGRTINTCNLLASREAFERLGSMEERRPPTFCFFEHLPEGRNSSPRVPKLLSVHCHSGGIWELAEREGFEPSNPFWGLRDFESRAFDHSAISP